MAVLRLGACRGLWFKEYSCFGLKVVLWMGRPFGKGVVAFLRGPYPDLGTEQGLLWVEPREATAILLALGIRV